MIHNLVKFFCFFSVSLSFFVPLDAQDCPYFFNGSCCEEAPCIVANDSYCGSRTSLGALALGAGAGALAGWATCQSKHSKSKKKHDACCPFLFDCGQTLTFNFCLEFQACNICPASKTLAITPYVMQPDGEIVYGEKVIYEATQSCYTCVTVSDRVMVVDPIFGTYHLGYMLDSNDSPCSSPNCWNSSCIQSTLCSESIIVDTSRFSLSVPLIFSTQSLISQFFQCRHQQIEVTEYVYPTELPPNEPVSPCCH